MTFQFARILRLRAAAAKEGQLDMWTIYERPKDFPNCAFVARRFIGDQPTRTTFTGETLEKIRVPFRRAGFVCLTRSGGDDPVIVETWL